MDRCKNPRSIDVSHARYDEESGNWTTCYEYELNGFIARHLSLSVTTHELYAHIHTLWFNLMADRATHKNAKITYFFMFVA